MARIMDHNLPPIHQNPILQDVSHLTEPELRRAIVATRSSIHSIDQVLVDHQQPVKSRPQFCIRSENELANMSEPDLLQEIANVSALLSLNPQIPTDESEMYILVARKSLEDLSHIHAGMLDLSEDLTEYCACRQLHHPNRSMVECEICRDWFHLTCVNVGADTLGQLKEFVCPSCSGESSVYELVNRRVNRVPSNFETKADAEHWRERDPEEMSEYQLVKSIHDSQREFTHTERELRKRLREESKHPTLNVDENSVGADLGVRWVRRDGKDVLRIPWVFVGPHLKKQKQPKKSARQRKLDAKTQREELLNSSVTDCAVCRVQTGLVVCCDSCPLMYHPECLFPRVSDASALPAVWNCHVCVDQNQQ